MSVLLSRCMHCTQHGLDTRKLSVCPSVCFVRSSVKRVICVQTKESSAHTLVLHERPFILGL